MEGGLKLLQLGTCILKCQLPMFFSLSNGNLQLSTLVLAVVNLSLLPLNGMVCF